ncbi:MAG TPA: hypothetical protein DDW94_01855 [Deltaproteobacteria bacterium]|nr:MAG: hypothetical protein A3I81_02350 [Deltaproteobacteria bacterium RIFCSPLOWO2_02_FULL_55_12]OIJ74785.1 MAG: hypothetical protein A2V21_311235 [Deltaproteobacteria bacterium GWC2_55_46]HBG45715.1 hypothetical protein [Deltaproteobacteria bacterium]HCY11123.1 hypothetical protein [Deltaproteobacteria bacterium]
MDASPAAIFVFTGEANGKTLVMARRWAAMPPCRSFVGLPDAGLETYSIRYAPVSNGVRAAPAGAVQALYMNGKRYSLG